MSEYKLIGLDMDGTLLNSKKKITPENMAAIEKAFSQGKEVVLSTGRSVAELREYTDIIKGLKYLVCTSGAMVYDLEKEETIYCAPIPNEVIDKVSEIAETSDVMVILQTTEAIAKKTDLDNLEHFHLNVYKELLNSVATKVDNVFEYCKQKGQSASKINIYHSTPEAREVTKKILSNAVFYSIIKMGQNNSKLFMQYNFQKFLSVEMVTYYITTIVFISRIARFVALTISNKDEQQEIIIKIEVYRRLGTLILSAIFTLILMKYELIVIEFILLSLSISEIFINKSLCNKLSNYSSNNR